jgi:type IV pilus assembly protein PilV
MNCLRRQRGFSLIDILVSVLILAFDLLDIGAMLGLILKSNSASLLKHRVVQSAYNITERSRADRATALAGYYNLSNLVTRGMPVLLT